MEKLTDYQIGVVRMIRSRMDQDYPHISYELSDEEVWNNCKYCYSVETAVQYFSDYLLSNGLADVQE